MLSTHKLAFSYRPDGVSIRFPELNLIRGEQVALVGPSGSGKTTLANLIAGILLPDAGHVRIDETEISSLSDSQRRDFRIANVGFIFQEFELVDYLNAEENILLPFLVNSSLQLDKNIRRRARELAESTGLADKLRRRPSQLSQGEKQRLAICRALITEPSLILADEPTGNLDSDTTSQILALIQAQARARDATVLMITHDRSLLDQFDRVIDLGAE
ncbi:MAG: putative ABC transport system ATP-binding protein [Rhodothermales bacterium]|jgi:putative ABC transport system ATP-binding protein